MSLMTLVLIKLMKNLLSQELHISSSIEKDNRVIKNDNFFGISVLFFDNEVKYILKTYLFYQIIDNYWMILNQLYFM